MIITASPYRNSLKNSNLNGKGYMGISLNSPLHSGENLEATINWINENAQYDQFLIGLSDTLNLHNMLNKKSYDDAYNKCLQEGNLWLKNNLSVLKKLKMPFTIKRWDSWKLSYNQEYSQYKTFYENLFQNDTVLRNGLLMDINNFCLRRHNKKINEMSFDFIQNSKNYLLEELIIYTLIFKKYGACDVYYPGKQLECMRLIREGIVQAIPDTYEKTNYIRMAIHSKDTPQKTAA